MILGGGLTGISTALNLRRRWLLIEKEGRLGGLARTDRVDGCLFDKTGHWLHVSHEHTRSVLDKWLPNGLTPVARKARFWFRGELGHYPFQANLADLPVRVAGECLVGFLRAWAARQAGQAVDEAGSFEDFILQTMGVGIARHFMIPYNLKLWGVHPRTMTAQWCRRFVPAPTREEVLAGVVGERTAESGYNNQFLYPRHGGIETLARAMASHLNRDDGQVALGSTLDWLDPHRRELAVDGQRVKYAALVSTIPLPELLQRMRNLPKELEHAGRLLRWARVRYLNIVVRSRVLRDFHWAYVPERRYPFYRVGVYSNVAPSMAPVGCGAIYVELSQNIPEPIGTARDVIITEVVRGLADLGVIESPQDVGTAELRTLDYGYVVFDAHYGWATQVIRSWLESHGIRPCGRYGYWTYCSMEDCILAGREVACAVEQGRGQAS